MPIQLQNDSDGTLAKVTGEGQLSTRAENEDFLFHNSWHEGEAYQVFVVDEGITSQTQTILHLKNTSKTHNCVIAGATLQSITNTASKPISTEYWSVGLGDLVTSGGNQVTPLNYNSTVNNVADVIVTAGDPTMSATYREIGRTYPIAIGSPIPFGVDNALILGFNDTVSLQYISVGTGIAYARVTFIMISKDR